MSLGNIPNFILCTHFNTKPHSPPPQKAQGTQAPLVLVTAQTTPSLVLRAADQRQVSESSGEKMSVVWQNK